MEMTDDDELAKFCKDKIHRENARHAIAQWACTECDSACVDIQGLSGFVVWDGGCKGDVELIHGVHFILADVLCCGRRVWGTFV